MNRLFLFDFDETLANHSKYNTLVYKLPVKVLPHIGGTIEGVPEVLDFLSSRGDDLAILTMNTWIDEQSKLKKIERVGILKWFRRKDIHMVKKKTPRKYRELVGDRELSDCYMVGNSLDHDILPALRAGLKAIYIPRGRNPFRGKKPPDDPKLFIMRDIREIISHYEDL